MNIDRYTPAIPQRVACEASEMRSHRIQSILLAEDARDPDRTDGPARARASRRHRVEADWRLDAICNAMSKAPP